MSSSSQGQSDLSEALSYRYKIHHDLSGLRVTRLTKTGLHRGMWYILRYPVILSKAIVKGFGYSIGLLPLVLLTIWMVKQ